MKPVDTLEDDWVSVSVPYASTMSVVLYSTFCIRHGTLVHVKDGKASRPA